MTIAFERIDRATARTKMRPSLVFKAFAVFGALTVPLTAVIAHHTGSSPSQIDLACFGFVGGIAGAFYAAVIESDPPEG